MANTAVSANRLELLQIADAVAREKVIDKQIVLDAMADAIAKAARSRYGAETDVHAEIHPKTGELRLARHLLVVDEVGYLPLERQAANLLFALVSRRYERGSIILTSSAASQDGQVGQVGYGSGKGAVNSMVLPMARDLMDLGIRVNAILPGTFATPPMLGVKEKAPAVYEGLEKAVPFPRRLGKPEEFGSLVMELVRNTYFNGQLIRLDGAIRMPPK